MKKILLFLLLFILSACKNSIQVNNDDELKLLRETDKNQSEACASKDLNRLLSFYEDDAIGIQNAPIRGKENLQKFWANAFSMPDYLLTWQAEDVFISESGDIGYTSGPWQQQWIQDGKLIKSNGRYLTIWRKQKDGTWKQLIGKP
jgi:ketosteroid isomerase-like protein